MNNGYMGKILEINLDEQKSHKIDTDPETARKFIGGKGYGAKLIWDRVPENVGPLDPENLLLFMPGPLTGTRAPSSARFSVVTKSPETGIYTDGHVGGYFGPKLKFCGFDGIIVTGKSDKPVYLHIYEDGCEIKDASELWGSGVFDTDDKLKEKYPDSSVAAIGQGGENLIKYACISFDKGRQAGRCGPGAVMGSKNLKAVVVEKGNKKPQYAEKDEFLELTKNLMKSINKHPNKIKRHVLGTLASLWEGIDGGVLPMKNFQGVDFPDIVNLVPEKLWEENIWQGTTTCYSCPIACTKLSKLKEGEYSGKDYEAPEYEIVALMGGNLLIDSYEWVTRGHIMCNDFGIDAISAGNCAGFAMECLDKGLIETDLDLEWGNGEALMEFIKRTVKREGIGDLFAEGVMRASSEIGQGSERFAIHVKGLELPGVDPRASFGMALAFATADRGGCHQRVWVPRAELHGKLKRFSTEGRAEFVKYNQDERAAFYSLDLCDFMPISEENNKDLLNLATGFDFSVEDYVKAGERIWNLTRMIGVREGISKRETDTLPERFFEEPLAGGAAEGHLVTREELDQMLDEYYELRGWDENGIPTEEKLKELELELD